MSSANGFTDLKGSIAPVGGVTFAGHHVISQSTFDPNESAFFSALKNERLFDGNKFSSNGTPLPNKLEGAVATGMAYHAGGHPAYNDLAARHP